MHVYFPQQNKRGVMQGEIQLERFEQFVRVRKHQFGDEIVSAVVEKVIDKIKTRNEQMPVIRYIDRYTQKAIDAELYRLNLRPVCHENYDMKLSRILTGIEEKYHSNSLQD